MNNAAWGVYTPPRPTQVRGQEGGQRPRLRTLRGLQATGATDQAQLGHAAQLLDRRLDGKGACEAHCTKSRSVSWVNTRSGADTAGAPLLAGGSGSSTPRLNLPSRVSSRKRMACL